MLPVAALRWKPANYSVLITMVMAVTLVSLTSSLPTIPSIVRPFYCVAPNDRLFTDCFLCGRLLQDRRIYYGCCRRHPLVINYCDQLLA